jgi:F0F1-type ATP synthase epsilon subunit
MISVIYLVITSPSGVVWEGNVDSISSKNSEGFFDILPDHARFISLVSGHRIFIELSSSTKKEFLFQSAVLFFEDNKATIYVQDILDLTQ